MPDFDFTAFVAMPRYYPHAGSVLAPWCYRRPDGACATCLGNTIAILVISGQHLPGEPLEYKVKQPGAYQKASGEFTDFIITKLTVPLFTARLVELQSLVGDPVPPPEPKPPIDVECPECRGAREVECPHCEQLMDCETCDGTGTVKEDSDPDDSIPCRYLRVNGYLYNVTVFAPLIAGLPDCEIELREGTEVVSKRLLVKGDGWSLLVQSLTLDGKPKEGETVVDFAKPEPAAVESA